MTLGDLRNKDVALGRIKRLAHSGLPLEPFLRTLFDLIDGALPDSAKASQHAGGERSGAHICASQASGIAPAHGGYFVEAQPEIWAVRFGAGPGRLVYLPPERTLQQHHGVFSSGLHLDEAPNNGNQPLGWRHAVAIGFQAAGRDIGYYGIWPAADHKALPADDIAFLEKAAPYAARGVTAALLMPSDAAGDTDFAAVPGSGLGVMLADHDQRLIAMDSEAKVVFEQLAILEGSSASALAGWLLRDVLAQLMFAVGNGLHEPRGASASCCGAPADRFYQHWSGIIVKLRAVPMLGAERGEYTMVLVQRGETSRSRRDRLIARWGLSQREAEVLGLIAEGKTGVEISILLGIGHDTVRKHTGRLFEKLGVQTRAAAAAAALEMSQ